ncbi:CLK4-associating serine/arginine rich protein-like [Sorghum bicolor]|uniref:CLK4-associating serine/arginine rich protein-like n=1 Tax=Sorghum bicolor TaxID=4558 RepID=UPI000B424A1A|nr:CLK4-associating serine/arginine rich protein-like [Sorghum bicolor]|eukprot:XP_021307503.1 CLK4-associating serine/arginine rich protein-like [Sorghum bicolor]
MAEAAYRDARPGSIDARSSKPPMKEDDMDRDKRRESAEKLKLKQTLEQAQPSMAKRLKVGVASKDSGFSDPWPSTGVESAPPRPLVGDSTPPSPKGREERKNASGRRSNNCRRGSSSRNRKEKKERRGGGQKEPSSRSYWSRTGSRSCGSSRSSSSRGASS